MTGVTVSGLTMASAGRQSRQKWDSQIHNRRSLRSISGVFLRTSEAHRFGAAEPGSRAQGQHANGRSRIELRGVLREKSASVRIMKEI